VGRLLRAHRHGARGQAIAHYRATLIVTTKESGLQSVEAVERYAARIPSARVIVLPGDSFHIAAVEPEVCAQHALRFMAEVSRPKQIAASREVG
jgi:3-oxoadipate enol-lactonase